MRFCQSFCCCLAIVIVIAGFVPSQNIQAQQSPNPSGQASSEPPLQPVPQRQTTPQEMRAIQNAIDQQQQERNNPLAAGIPANVVIQPPPLPPGFPLPHDQEVYIGQLLDHWQKSSDQVKRSSCDFMRRSYNPEDCNVRDSRNNHLFPYNIALGKLYFSTPDQGRFETDENWNFAKPPTQPGLEPEYTPLDIDKHREKWICDGRAIYQFDYSTKRLNEVKIPPQLQGNGLVNSPLPFFMFGADKKIILERYWIRPITPAGVDNAYWLEAYPKRIEDARIYKKMEIIISRDDFLPSSLVLFASNYDESKNPTKQSFEFSNRKINSHLSAITDFLVFFRRPPTPIGWKRTDLSSATIGQQPQGSGENLNR